MKQHWFPDHTFEAKTLRNIGCSFLAIGKAMGFSANTVQYHLDKKFKDKKTKREADACVARASLRPPKPIYDREAYLREYRRRPENKARARSYHAVRNQDPHHKMRKLLHTRMHMAVKHQYGKRCLSTIELLGCSIETVRAHLEAQFKPGMSWDNHGRGGWTIDHIRPCDSFDLTDPEEQQKCFHYTNLQPLWEADNIRKSNHYV